MNLRHIIILRIKNGDYHCIISGISKREAINLLWNTDLTEKIETLKIKYQEQFLKLWMYLKFLFNQKKNYKLKKT